VTTPNRLRTLFACAIATSLLVSASACGGGDGASPDQISGVPEREVSFTTSDGVDLTGRVFGKSRAGLVLSHMYPADARSWYGSAKELAAAGYMALAFNFRGYADSDGEKSPSKAAIDVRAAIAELQDRGARDVALVGASMGGTASIVAAEDRTPLAVVAISAPARFQTLDAIAVAQSVQRPVLLMASRNDAEAFRSLQELERALPNPDTKIYDGEAHGTALLTDRPEAVAEIIAFLQRYAPTNGVPSTPEGT
jgi:pimeloyl-ACP methyl ester carboxylesterase